MFFWIFGFTFIIGIMLLIKQHFQKCNMLNKVSILEENKILKNKEIEELKQQNEDLLNCIEKMKQKESEYIKHKSEDDVYINNIFKELEYYKSEMGSIQEKIEKYCITDEEINKKKGMIKELNDEFERIQENKMTEISKTLYKKYNSMTQELNVYYKGEKEKLQNEYDSKVQELKESYGKLLLYYGNEIKDINNEYENIKSDYEEEIKDINNEIEKLNSDCIIEYYSFSDYNGTTSEDCKNKLSILKQKEKEMRNNGEDIYYKSGFYENKRTQQRIIRKILRTFNAECNNFIFNIKVKNIDIERKKLKNHLKH